jgi:hypothetical protein
MGTTKGPVSKYVKAIALSAQFDPNVPANIK